MQPEPGNQPESTPETANTNSEPRLGLFARAKATLRAILQLDDTPESIARGFALGMFVAMTPTVGIQMAIVAVVNTIAKANRAAGVVMVYISNPLTMIPIYWFDYQIGRLVLDQPAIEKEAFEKIFDLRGPNLFAKLQSFVSNLAEFSWDVAGPLFLGGFIVGAVLGVITYPIALNLVRRFQNRNREGQPQSSPVVTSQN